MVTIEDLQSILPNAKFNSNKSHLVSDCIYCGKEKHFYVSVQPNKLGHHQCKKCGEAGHIKRLLRHLQRTDLLDEFDFDLRRIILESNTNKEVFNLYNPTVDLPNRAKRIYDSEYLNSRGFLPPDYEKYPVYQQYGENAVIFPIYENDEVKAYSTRSTLPNDVTAKAGIRRWTHSKGSDLSRLLYGIDNIGSAKIVVLVEGILDKISFDRKMELLLPEVCCVCMFGKSISRVQSIKLNNAGFKTAILMFDRDAVYSTKKLSFKLQDYIDNVFVAPLGSKDPDTASVKELAYALNNCKTPLEFYTQYI